jgi:hypothetical protein
VQSFPFFPQLHILLATHPNLNPVALTTGVGPNGREVMNYRGSAAQHLVSDDLIDPALRTTNQNTQGSSTLTAAISTALPPTPIPITIGQENVPPVSTPPLSTPTQGPKASTFGSAKLDVAVAKATSAIQRVPKKRSIEDTFLAVQGWDILFDG